MKIIFSAFVVVLAFGGVRPPVCTGTVSCIVLPTSDIKTEGEIVQVAGLTGEPRAPIGPIVGCFGEVPKD